MALGGVGRLHGLAVTLAASTEVWRTEQAPAALSGLKVHGSFELPASTLEPVASPTTDSPFLTTRDTAGNIPGVEFEVEVPKAYYRTAGTSNSPLEKLLFGCLTGASTVTQQAATAAYLHTFTEASLHGLLQQPPTRFASVADKLPLDSGQIYESVPSALVNGFELESGPDGVKIIFKLRGNKVVLDSATVSGGWANITYADWTKQLRHYHAKDLIWLAKSAAEGASPVTFGASQAIHPSTVTISYDWGLEDQHTDAQDTDLPDSQAQPKISVKLKFLKILAANKALFETNFAAYADDTDAYFHFLIRWKYPVAIATTYFPYLEIGFPKLMLKKPDPLKKAPGKLVEHSMEFEALAPTASSHLPTQFPYGGGASGTRQDAMYVALMGTSSAAIIA